jgi:uncharacterized protein (DUF305 family)
MRALALIMSLAALAGSAQAAGAGAADQATGGNAAAATAAARNIARQTDPNRRAASCHIFLQLSIDHHSRAVGFSEAAMERAKTGFHDALVRQMGGWQVADGLIGETTDSLEAAAPAARDAASRYCMAHPMPARARRGH